MSIFLDKEIKHQAFVCGKIHVLKTKPGCYGTSCMRDSVPVCLLPCAVLLICLFNRVHTNLLLGPFALSVLACKEIVHPELQLVLTRLGFF